VLGLLITITDIKQIRNGAGIAGKKEWVDIE